MGAANSEIERSVLNIWCQVFGRTEISIDDDFFEIGGHSLLMMRIVADFEKEFGVTLTLRDFFDDATPARMAALIDRDPSTASDGERPPTDAILEGLLAEVESLSEEQARDADPGRTS